MMHRIAVRIARLRGLAALVTGESLGQVASQTLENLELTAAASELPVLRPLVTFDKEEIVALARKIGTYEASIVPAADCCTLFQPARPRIRGVAREAEENERRLEVDELVGVAVSGLQTWVFRHGNPGAPAQPAASVAGGP
jgi:thiamine biosynthesis protein ThiI